MNRHFAGSGLHRLLLAILCVSLSAPVRSACAQAHVTGPKEVDTSTVVQGDTTDENVVSIMGKVTSVQMSSTGMTFINIGRSWAFAAIILATDSSSFPNPKQWEGKRVRVTGKVQRYEARAAMVLRQPWQLALASPGPNPR
jgi:hypothetical protein